MYWNEHEALRGFKQEHFARWSKEAKVFRILRGEKAVGWRVWVSRWLRQTFLTRSARMVLDYCTVAQIS